MDLNASPRGRINLLKVKFVSLSTSKSEGKGTTWVSLTSCTAPWILSGPWFWGVLLGTCSPGFIKFSKSLFQTVPPQKSRAGLFRDGWMDSLIHSFIVWECKGDQGLYSQGAHSLRGRNCRNAVVVVANVLSVYGMLGALWDNISKLFEVGSQK